MFLAADVGATKILLEVGDLRSGRWQTLLARRYSTHDELDFPEVLREFLTEWNSERPPGHGFLGAGFGVAGPVTANKAKMTNRPWVIDGDVIARRFPIPRVRVVNDLAAAAHGIDWLDASDLAEIQPGNAEEHEPRVVIGIGTGLGIAYRIWADGRWREVSGEAGHANFAPATLKQAELWRSIFATHGRVSVEDVLSGRGLQHVYAFTSGKKADPAEITAGALKNDSECTAALELFAECGGSIAGDHALAVLARGGVYLTGGIVAKLAPWLQRDRFRSAFCAKGPHSTMMMRIPVYAVTNERVAVLGAARLAAEE